MTTEPNKLNDSLEIDGTLTLESTDTGFGLLFKGSQYSIGVKGSNSLILQKGSHESGVRDRIFEVSLEISEDRSTVLKKEFRFDNVDVFPDNNDQKLGREENQWSEVHAKDGIFSGILNIKGLRQAPQGAQTAELLVDRNTGELYYK